jgi:hypothetical protein
LRALITSKHFSNALVFDSGSLVVTRISTGIFPSFSGLTTEAIYVVTTAKKGNYQRMDFCAPHG